MFDTHCHLNFKAFEGRVEEVVNNEIEAGISLIVVPGTDRESSEEAVKIAERFSGVYAAVGIHPHHVFQINQKTENRKNQSSDFSYLLSDLSEIEKLLVNPKVVAVGEVGVDRHYYSKTKYPNYNVYPEFIEGQKEFLNRQIDLGLKYNKSLIFHNREAKKDFLEVVRDKWDEKLAGRAVFHCCEPDSELLNFAKKHKIFIGIDGDITFREDKQEFIKTVPLDLLVLETDSPFLLPSQLRVGNKKRPANEPKNLQLVAVFIAELLRMKTKALVKITTENSKKLFQIS